MHHFYHRDGKTSIEKMQEEARWLLIGGWSGDTPEESIIHMHPYENYDCALKNVSGSWMLNMPEWAAYAVTVSDVHEWYTFAGETKEKERDSNNS